MVILRANMTKLFVDWLGWLMDGVIIFTTSQMVAIRYRTTIISATDCDMAEWYDFMVLSWYKSGRLLLVRDKPSAIDIY